MEEAIFTSPKIDLQLKATSMSQYKGLTLSLVSQVSYVDVQTYARSTGWKRVPNVKGEITVYHYPEDGTQELIL